MESSLANMSIVVQRDHATFGSASVFCYAQSVKNGATQNQDFLFTPQVYLNASKLLSILIFKACK